MILLSKRFNPEACVSSNELRPAICGVLVGNNRVVATNAYVLVVMPCETDENEKILSPIAFKVARLYAKKEDEKIKISSEGQVIPEKFPSLDGIIQEDGDVSFCVNLENLQKVSKALGSRYLEIKIKSSDTRQLKIYPVTSDLEPLDGYGVVMLMRKKS